MDLPGHGGEYLNIMVIKLLDGVDDDTDAADGDDDDVNAAAADDVDEQC